MYDGAGLCLPLCVCLTPSYSQHQASRTVAAVQLSLPILCYHSQYCFTGFTSFHLLNSIIIESLKKLQDEIKHSKKQQNQPTGKLLVRSEEKRVPKSIMSVSQKNLMYQAKIGNPLSYVLYAMSYWWYYYF